LKRAAPRERAGRAPTADLVFVHDRRHAAREPGLRQRGDDRLDPQAVRGAPAERLVFVDAAAGAVQPERGQNVLGDRQSNVSFDGNTIGATVAAATGAMRRLYDEIITTGLVPVDAPPRHRA
jgi:hypothetical protein